MKIPDIELLVPQPVGSMSYTKAELQEVAKVWNDILLGFDGHHQRHYLGLTVPHPAAPRVMLTVRRIVEQVVKDTQ